MKATHKPTQSQDNYTITYLNCLFQSYIKSRLGYELTQSHKRQALDRMAHIPSHHHFMYQNKLDRASKFEQWLNNDTQHLQNEMHRAGYKFRDNYRLDDLATLSANHFNDIIERA